MKKRYVIIGTGVAGISAAESILQRDSSSELILIGEEDDGYYSRPGLAYFLNRTLPEQQLIPMVSPDLHRLIANQLHARVTGLLPDAHQVILAGEKVMEYDRLLLATGSRAAPADFPGANIPGVVNLYTLADVRQILSLARGSKQAVVVGGGIIAVELAEGLAANGLKVDYFLRGERFWAKTLSEAESRQVERGLQRIGIRIHYHTQVAQTLQTAGVLSGVVTKAGQTFDCQILGVAIGVVPQDELAQQAGIKTDRGILVNEFLETNVEDIYAAGDVARVCDSRSGESWLETLWPTARMQGEIAGENMAGGRRFCRRGSSFNAVCIGSIMTVTVGAVERGQDADILTFVSNQRPASCPPNRQVSHRDEFNQVRILVGERSIVGAVIMGDQSLSQPLIKMIDEEMDISSIRPNLLADPSHGVDLIASHYYKEHSSYVRS